MDCRAALELLLGAATLPVFGACSKEATRSSPTMTSRSTTRTPAIFIAHGSPFLLDDAEWVSELARWAEAMPKPRAILMVSAHWVDAPVTLAATKTVPLVYDFYGFPKKYYDVTYAAPGAPELAKRVRELVPGTRSDDSRGLDHGAYVPLIAMYRGADVPVLQMSIPTMDPASLYRLGKSLAPLRDEGVLIAGSGFLTHNMSSVEFGGSVKPPAWAAEFDAWAEGVLAKRDVDALLDYRARAPGVRTALPTHEHFVPVLVATGASDGASESVAFPITGFAYGSFTKRSLQLG